MSATARPRRRLTGPGAAWLAVVAVVLAIGLYKSINLLALFGCCLLALLVLHALTVGPRLGRLRGRRRLGDAVFAGAPFAIDAELTNAAARPVVGVRLEDRDPRGPHPWFVPRLEAGRTVTFRREVTLPRRGRYAWGPLVAATAYPFGLVRRRVDVDGPAELIVLPRVGRLHRGKLRRVLRGGVPRPATRPQAGRRSADAQDEFHSLRPYRAGDSPRTIHWPTSARRGELFVREFEDSPGDNLLVVFDPVRPGTLDVHPPDFEGAVCLAATLCWEWCRRRDDFLGLALATPLAPVLAGYTSAAHARALLGALAVVEPVAAADPAALVRPLLDPALPASAVALIGLGPPRLAEVLRDELRRPLVYLDALQLADMDFYEPPR